LNSRQEALGVLLKSVDQPGPGVPLLHELRDTAAAGLDDGQLGAGEKAVQEDQDRNGDQFQPHQDTPSPSGFQIMGHCIRNDT
jgi:hypothetical protein